MTQLEDLQLREMHFHSLSFLTAGNLPQTLQSLLFDSIHFHDGGEFERIHQLQALVDLYFFSCMSDLTGIAPIIFPVPNPHMPALARVTMDA
jgi:hypothetical protein